MVIHIIDTLFYHMMCLPLEKKKSGELDWSGFSGAAEGPCFGFIKHGWEVPFLDGCFIGKIIYDLSTLKSNLSPVVSIGQQR